jgi:hypothetical protein
MLTCPAEGGGRWTTRRRFAWLVSRRRIARELLAPWSASIARFDVRAPHDRWVRARSPWLCRVRSTLHPCTRTPHPPARLVAARLHTPRLSAVGSLIGVLRHEHRHAGAAGFPVLQAGGVGRRWHGQDHVREAPPHRRVRQEVRAHDRRGGETLPPPRPCAWLSSASCSRLTAIHRCNPLPSSPSSRQVKMAAGRSPICPRTVAACTGDSLYASEWATRALSPRRGVWELAARRRGRSKRRASVWRCRMTARLYRTHPMPPALIALDCMLSHLRTDGLNLYTGCGSTCTSGVERVWYTPAASLDVCLGDAGHSRLIGATLDRHPVVLPLLGSPHPSNAAADHVDGSR